jgi:RNA polymerase sigma factor for flagellar operon FliA
MPEMTTRRAPTRARHDDRGAERQAILARHLGLVYHVARQIARSSSVDAEVDELVSAGTIGLIEAYENFDESRGLAFSTFAAPRIRGAMLDELRRQDRVPRAVRRRSRQLAGVSESLSRALGREPKPSELARGLGIDLDTFFKWQAEGACTQQVSLDRAADDVEHPRLPAEFLIGSAGTEIDDELTHRQEAAHLRDAILELGEQERTVLSLHYFEELRLCEVARILGVSESRVSQIRAKAIARLRGKLGGLREAVA